MYKNFLLAHSLVHNINIEHCTGLDHTSHLNYIIKIIAENSSTLSFLFGRRLYQNWLLSFQISLHKFVNVFSTGVFQHTQRDTKYDLRIQLGYLIHAKRDNNIFRLHCYIVTAYGKGLR